MKKKLFLIVILFICLIISGCENNSDEEIDRIGNLINGTE